MAHTKRQQIPRNWPIEKKGSTFIVRPFRSLEEGVPVLVVLRDMLKIVQNRKEAKKIINNKNILLNEKPIKSEKNAVLLFDVLKLIPTKQNFRLELDERGKFSLKEISKKEADKKISKIQGKNVLKGKKTQLNLSDGRNFISDIECSVNDSVVIDLKNKKIEKALPMKKGAKVLIFAGKHSGDRGSIENLDSERKTAEIKTQNKEKINALIKQIIVTE